MGYRLIALDIDGTIRSIEREPTARTRDAIASVMAAGTMVTLATGRAFKAARAHGVELGITSPIISFQGAHVADPRTCEAIRHVPLSPTMAAEALDSLAGWRGDLVLYQGGDRVRNGGQSVGRRLPRAKPR